MRLPLPPALSASLAALLFFVTATASAEEPARFLSAEEVGALGLAPSTRVTLPAGARLRAALAQVESCSASSAAIGAVITNSKGVQTPFAWRFDADVPAGRLDTRSTSSGEPAMAYALAFGRLGIDSLDEIWPTVDTADREVLVGVRKDKVELTFGFDERNRLRQIQGAMMSITLEWTDLPDGRAALAALDLLVARQEFTRRVIAGCGLPAVAELRMKSGELLARTEIDAVAIDPPNGRRQIPSGATGIPFATRSGSFDAAKGGPPRFPAGGAYGGVVGGMLGGMMGGRAPDLTEADLNWRAQPEPAPPGWMDPSADVLCLATMPLNTQGVPTGPAQVTHCLGAFAAAYADALSQWRAEPAGPLAGGSTFLVSFRHRFVGKGRVDGLPFVSATGGTLFHELAGGVWLEEPQSDGRCAAGSDAALRANALARGEEGLEAPYALSGVRALRRPWVTTGYRLPTQAEADTLGLDVLTEGETVCEAARLVRRF